MDLPTRVGTCVISPLQHLLPIIPSSTPPSKGTSTSSILSSTNVRYNKRSPCHSATQAAADSGDNHACSALPIEGTVRCALGPSVITTIEHLSPLYHRQRRVHESLQIPRTTDTIFDPRNGSSLIVKEQLSHGLPSVTLIRRPDMRLIRSNHVS